LMGTRKLLRTNPQKIKHGSIPESMNYSNAIKLRSKYGLEENNVRKRVAKGSE